jgi:hypothetical protein
MILSFYAQRLIKQLFLGLGIIVKALAEHVVSFRFIYLMHVSTAAVSLNLRPGYSVRCSGEYMFHIHWASNLNHRV